jgi:hypothetical protein
MFTNANINVAEHISLYGNIYGNSSTIFGNLGSMNNLVLSNNISMNGTVAQFGTSAQIPASYAALFNLSDYVTNTALNSYNNNDVNIYTRLMVASDVSLNNRLFLQSDLLQKNGNHIITKGNISLTSGNIELPSGNITVSSGTITSTNGIINGSLTVYGLTDCVGGLLIGNTTTINDSSFNGKLYVGGDVSLNANLYVTGYTEIDGITFINNTTASTSTTTGALKVAGGVGITGNCIAGSFSTASDYRIKENIVDLDANYTIDNLRPVKYDNKLTNKEDVGFIAHELKEEYPYLVNGEKDAEELQSVNYIGLIGILVKEIQGLKQENKSMRGELDDLKELVKKIIEK